MEFEKPLTSYKYIIYTDGACSSKTKKGGFATVIFISDKKFIYYSDYRDDTTNNQMELYGILRAYAWCLKNHITEALIYSDSAYCVNMLNNWIYNWAGNEWRKADNTPIKNLELVQLAFGFIKVLPQIKVEKIAGHSGEIGNELADALAANNPAKFDKIIKDNNLTGIQINE